MRLQDLGDRRRKHEMARSARLGADKDEIQMQAMLESSAAGLVRGVMSMGLGPAVKPLANCISAPDNHETEQTDVQCNHSLLSRIIQLGRAGEPAPHVPGPVDDITDRIEMTPLLDRKHNNQHEAVTKGVENDAMSRYDANMSHYDAAQYLADTQRVDHGTLMDRSPDMILVAMDTEESDLDPDTPISEKALESSLSLTDSVAGTRSQKALESSLSLTDSVAGTRRSSSVFTDDLSHKSRRQTSEPGPSPWCRSDSNTSRRSGRSGVTTVPNGPSDRWSPPPTHQRPSAHLPTSRPARQLKSLSLDQSTLDPDTDSRQLRKVKSDGLSRLIRLPDHLSDGHNGVSYTMSRLLLCTTLLCMYLEHVALYPPSPPPPTVMLLDWPH